MHQGSLVFTLCIFPFLSSPANSSSTSSPSRAPARVLVSLVLISCINLPADFCGGSAHFFAGAPRNFLRGWRRFLRGSAYIWFLPTHKYPPYPGGGAPLLWGLARGALSNSAVFCKQGAPVQETSTRPETALSRGSLTFQILFCIPCRCSVIHAAVFL